MLKYWDKALADYGWVLAIGIIALFALAITYIWNPVKTAEEEVVEPIGAAVGIEDKRCPDGWDDTSASDEHQVVHSCQKVINGKLWLVILNPDDNSFNYAIVPDSPNFETDKTKVPGWPK